MRLDHLGRNVDKEVWYCEWEVVKRWSSFERAESPLGLWI